MKNTAIILLLVGAIGFSKAQLTVGGIPVPQAPLVFSTGLTVQPVGQTTINAMISNNEACVGGKEAMYRDDCDEEMFPPACSVAGVGGTTTQTQHTVATGAVIIPAIQVAQTLDCITQAKETTMGTVHEGATAHTSFDVCGALRTNAWECAEGNECADESWSTCGSGDCTYNEGHATCSPCKVDCRPMKALDFDSFDDVSCASDCTCGKKAHKECQDPSEDVEHRINRQVDSVLSDILSNAISKCISEGLQGCIQI